MKLVNLTPHTVNILHPDDCEYSQYNNSWYVRGRAQPIATFPPEREPAFCEYELEDKGCIAVPSGVEGERSALVPIVGRMYSRVANLPEETDNTMYIVNATAAKSAWKSGRHDVLIQMKLVRYADSGKIAGCLALSDEAY